MHISFRVVIGSDAKLLGVCPGSHPRLPNSIVAKKMKLVL